MQSKRSVAAILAVMIAGGSALAIAAEGKPGQAPGRTPETKQMPMDRGMMDGGMMGDRAMGGMMGMMNMMHQCNRMMSSGMGGGMMGGMPQLPPGNEKLQVQMQAEIMQKMGEIVAKYAGRVKDQPT